MRNAETLTHGIRVKVQSSYSEEHSRPDEQHWLFLYTIEISNEGNETVQLLSRYWTIVDGDGNTQVVTGQGVVGQQPILEPGESFRYTSACPLTTEFGSMQGHYQLITDAGQEFSADIPAFTLFQQAYMH